MYQDKKKHKKSPQKTGGFFIKIHGLRPTPANVSTLDRSSKTHTPIPRIFGGSLAGRQESNGFDSAPRGFGYSVLVNSLSSLTVRYRWLTPLAALLPLASPKIKKATARNLLVLFWHYAVQREDITYRLINFVFFLRLIWNRHCRISSTIRKWIKAKYRLNKPYNTLLLQKWTHPCKHALVCYFQEVDCI